MGSAEVSKGYHALVYGASGITGWAIVNQILNNYPDATTFSKVTALTNRPLSPEVTQWPKSSKLELVSGLDLLKESQEELEKSMQEKISGIRNVTHVFFFAYIMDADPEQEIAINVDLLKRAVVAIEHLSTNLQFVVLPTGTKVCCPEGLPGSP
jgi:nucleoside-diphosphate-sugar epimerase